MARYGGDRWFPATLPTRAASMVSELSIAAAHGNFPGEDLAPWRFALRSSDRSRSGYPWQSESWDPGDNSDLHANWRLKLQPDELERQWNSVAAHLPTRCIHSRMASSSSMRSVLKVDEVESLWITHLKVGSNPNLDHWLKEMRHNHQVFDEMVKRDMKPNNCMVSSQLLNQVQHLLYEIPEEVVKTPEVVGRLMSILRRVKQRGLVADYVTCFVEAARIASDFIARYNYMLEDQFLVMMFVVGLKEEVRYEVQTKNPKTLLEAIDFAQLNEKELLHQPAEFIDTIPGLTRELQLRFEMRSKRKKLLRNKIAPAVNPQLSTMSSSHDVSDSDIDDDDLQDVEDDELLGCDVESIGTSANKAKELEMYVMAQDFYAVVNWAKALASADFILVPLSLTSHQKQQGENHHSQFHLGEEYEGKILAFDKAFIKRVGQVWPQISSSLLEKLQATWPKYKSIGWVNYWIKPLPHVSIARLKQMNDDLKACLGDDFGGSLSLTLGSAISGQTLAFDPGGGTFDVFILGSLSQDQYDLKLLQGTHVIRFEPDVHAKGGKLEEPKGPDKQLTVETKQILNVPLMGNVQALIFGPGGDVLDVSILIYPGESQYECYFIQGDLSFFEYLRYHWYPFGSPVHLPASARPQRVNEGSYQIEGMPLSKPEFQAHSYLSNAQVGEEAALNGTMGDVIVEESTAGECKEDVRKPMTSETRIIPLMENDQHVHYHLPPLYKANFSISDLVWGKVKSHPWWPGQIFDPSDATKLAMKYQKKDSFLIGYFGDKTFAWCDESQLKSFHSYFSQLENQCTSDTFVKAIRDIMTEVSRRVELGMACSCLPEEDYTSIKYQKVKNGGIRGGNINSIIDRHTVANCFQPDRLLDYIESAGVQCKPVLQEITALVAGPNKEDQALKTHTCNVMKLSRPPPEPPP